MENSWNIESLYDLRYYNCPSCDCKTNLKQEFINHAYDSHPEIIYYLKNIKDDSLDDVSWNKTFSFCVTINNIITLQEKIDIVDYCWATFITFETED